MSDPEKIAVSISQSASDRDIIMGLKRVHQFLKQPQKLIQIVSVPKVIPRILDFILVDNADVVIEVFFLLTKLFEVSDDQFLICFTEQQFVQQLYERVRRPQFESNLTSFKNGLEIQQLFYLTVNNLCSQPITFVQVLESPIPDFILAQSRLPTSPRVRRFIILAVSNILYQAELQSEQLTRLGYELLQFTKEKDPDSVFACVQAVYAYSCIENNIFQFDLNLIVKLCEVQLLEVKTYQTERIANECIKILYNYSDGEQLLKANIISGMAQILLIAEEYPNFQRGILNCVLNMTSGQTGCGIIAKHTSMREKMIGFFMLGHHTGLLIQIYQNLLFYGQMERIDPAFVTKCGKICQLALLHDEEYANDAVNLVNQLCFAPDGLKGLKNMDWSDVADRGRGIEFVIDKVDRGSVSTSDV
ncbi:Conserved_hypothetical protein [Hexamita inflata]|uniref:Uncharacterized protein n=1 Tax=Hexamita inflata TaxID=28002 RepID=A0AA86UP56_9EUKA|nr:Conserved hypothetical protein [Hexamita inflata]